MKHTMRRSGWKHYGPALLLATLLVSAPSPTGAGTIVGSKHDLSATGPGPIQATTEQRVCVFCHTPHHAIREETDPAYAGIEYPLWNHQLSAATYIVPSEYLGIPLLSSPEPKPDGDSRLCLSCHDGTVAVGAVVNVGSGTSPIAMQGTGLTADGRLDPTVTSAAFPFVSGSVDISGHHPVSIVVNQTFIDDLTAQCSGGFGVVLSPTAPVKYRPTNNQYKGVGGNGVQCTSCHDPHDDRGGGVWFLRTGDQVSTQPLCDSCHYLCP